MAARMPAVQLRGLLVDDDGEEYRQAPGMAGGLQTRAWGEDLMQKRRDASVARFDDVKSFGPGGVRIGVDGKPMGFLRPSSVALNPEWDGYHGIMAGVKNAAASEGRSMATSYASRPSMRSLASGTFAPPPTPAADGWEPPEVRTAKLGILQGQHNRIADDNNETARQRDPAQRAYDTRMDDESDVASFERRLPIYRGQRDAARSEDIQDIRDRATETGTNPFLREEKEFERGMARDRASMDAFSRLLSGIKPETAELFENNPGLIDTIRERSQGRGPAPNPNPNPAPVGVEDKPAADPGYGAIQSADQMPPVVRAEIEQFLRENRYAVNDKNLMAAYQRLQQ